jgi:hypothetical protein
MLLIVDVNKVDTVNDLLKDMKIHHFLAMTSAVNILNVDVIFIHTDCPPTGFYWEKILTNGGSKIKIIKRSPPVEIWNQKIEKVEHLSDVARLEILIEVGGIYGDDDLVFLKVNFKLLCDIFMFTLLGCYRLFSTFLDLLFELTTGLFQGWGSFYFI